MPTTLHLSSSPLSRRLAIFQSLCAGVFMLITLRLLWMELDVDDTFTYAYAIYDHKWKWDPAHLFIQPLAHFLFNLTGLEREAPMIRPIYDFLSSLNTIHVALAIAILWYTTCRLGVSLYLRLIMLILAGFSFNMISLAPTGHIKLLYLPWFCLGMHHLIMWETSIQQQDSRALNLRLVIAGINLAISMTFLLVTVIPALFAGCATLIILVKRKQAWLVPILCFAGSIMVTGLTGLIIGWLLAAKMGLGGDNILDFIITAAKGKMDLHAVYDPGNSLISLARFCYTIIYNFIFMPVLGQTIQAYMAGMIENDKLINIPGIIRDVIGMLVTIAILFWVLILGIKVLIKPKRKDTRPVVLCIALLCGGLVYSFFYNLNDPEHWLHITPPFAIMTVLVATPLLLRALLLLWLPLLLLLNLGIYAIPRAVLDVQKHEAVMERLITPNKDLLVCYAGYPGEPNGCMYRVHYPSRLLIDVIFKKSRSLEDGLDYIERRIEQVLNQGHSVYAFRVFDEGDWRGPVIEMHNLKTPVKSFRDRISRKFTVKPLGIVAGFPMWQILPREFHDEYDLDSSHPTQGLVSEY